MCAQNVSAPSRLVATFQPMLERRAHLRLLREFLHHHMGDGRAFRALDGWEARLRRPA